MRLVEDQATQSVDTVELSSIAVAAPAKGVGGVLLEAFADKARDEGAHRIILTTDAEGNDAVRGFYEGPSFTLDGIEM
jgi:GNAT superfamily N-acetyltransferase